MYFLFVSGNMSSVTGNGCETAGKHMFRMTVPANTPNHRTALCGWEVMAVRFPTATVISSTVAMQFFPFKWCLPLLQTKGN